MRLARFSLNDSPRYAFVQKDETDGKDYLIELDGHPLAGDQVKPTGTRYPVDGDGIRLLAPVIPSKVYGLAKNYEATPSSCTRPATPKSPTRRKTW